MILRSIQLKNFRVHRDTSIEFSDKLNFLVGGNGQGKTSVLEAIYYLCTTKCFSNTADSEVVNFEEDHFEVQGSFKDLTENSVRVYFSQQENKKYITIDGKQLFRASGLIGRFPVVILTPEDHSLTEGSPADRRKFIDSVISQASETYLQILLEYNRVLRQRSSLLSQIRDRQDNTLYKQFDAWTARLIQTGSEIIRHRIEFIKEFSRYVESSYQYIMEGDERPSISYEYLDGLKPEKDKIEETFIELLESKREEELRRCINLAGPHRDEFIFRINSFEIKKYGSQGQNKTFQIALRFAQFFYLSDALSKVPVFLLDDVFGELDAYRAAKISDYLKDIGQAFITMTDLSDMTYLNKTEKDALITIQGGKASYA